MVSENKEPSEQSRKLNFPIHSEDHRRPTLKNKQNNKTILLIPVHANIIYKVLVLWYEQFDSSLLDLLPFLHRLARCDSTAYAE